MCATVTIDPAQTGRNIISLRMQKGLSVRDIQDVFGFATPQAIYKWQHGTAMPTIDNLVQLAALLDVSIDDIVAKRIVPARNEIEKTRDSYQYDTDRGFLYKYILWFIGQCVPLQAA